ncbi:ABC transporter substrate-binding protein [Chachezhania sediminis]|uniref:ABC transporter substrate-binding protein n=1 Tax=Chachezhania sediminis TaxID=2599291 RepID=UPI001E628F1D|nr:ABC transporter substrate-binding protein [Chachezhania sediminis]
MRALRLSALLGLLAVPTPVGAAPARVVSMNLCTDQLAMLLAAPGQLLSVSWLARDPRSSAMPEEAEAYPFHHGGAEEIFLLNPDLVIAGRYTGRATVAMLERLGIPVLIVDPARSLDDVRDRIAEVGAALGRAEEADRLIAGVDARLASLRAAAPAIRKRAAIYAARGYTSGPASLSGAILDAAGLDNVAAEAGFAGGGQLPLEQLVMLDPDLVVLPTRWPAASVAEEILDHPALRSLQARARVAPLTDSDWVCGTPAVLNAVETLARAAEALE